MTNQTSIWAYEDIRKSGYLGKNQARYLFVFARAGRPMTALEAREKVEIEFGCKMPERNGRPTELCEMGFTEQVDTVECPITHKTVTRWRWTGRKQGRIESFKNCPCDKCKGTGFIRKKVWVEPDGQKELFEPPKPNTAERGTYD